MQVSRKDFDRMEVFVQRICKAKTSNYVKNFKGIKVKQDLITDEVHESKMPNDEDTNNLATLIRPCLLPRDDCYYEKLIKIIESLIDQMPQVEAGEYRKNLIPLRKTLEDIRSNKANAFNLFMYGEYAKSDVEKAKKIQAAPPIVKAGFHAALIKVSEALLTLANAYVQLKDEYGFNIDGPEVLKNRTYTIGL